MIQYYNRFIPKMAKSLASLNEMSHGRVKNSEKLNYTTESKNAFVSSKPFFAESSLLVDPDSSAPVAVNSDSSDIGIGSVL